MTDRSRTTGDDRSQNTSADGFQRREFVALGAGVGAAMLAGCAGDGGLASGGADDSDGSDGSQTLTGNFRLLISDAPADIGDFDELNVTLDEARVFEAKDGDDEGGDDEDGDDEDGEADEEDDGSGQTGNETDEETDSPDGTADEGDDESDDDADEDDEDDSGFTVVALDDATVDLTQVLGDDATAVFDGEIPAGSYEKIELEVSDVEGIVNGEAVDVKLPSEKLQITNDFEVTPDEPVDFVFDINVVKRGPNNGYILRPVISGSGVAGRDVDVTEIDDDDEDDDAEDEDAEDEDAEDDDEDDDAEDSGIDEDADETGDSENDAAAGNETDDTENETAA